MSKKNGKANGKAPKPQLPKRKTANPQNGKPGAKPKRRVKWDDKFYITIYELARDGLSRTRIAKTLGVKLSTLNSWCTDNPAVADAMERGGGFGGSGMQTIQDYIYKRLSPEMQDVWQEITAWEKVANGLDQIEQILSLQGRRVRQTLFVHAYLVCNFNASKACQKVNVPYSSFLSWCRNEPHFLELMQEMMEHKKNFLEDALFKLIKRGDGPATIFANKTLNKDRGYGEKVVVEVGGSVEHQHTHQLKIEDLNLPLEVRKQLLIAVREQREGESEVIEGEYSASSSNGSNGRQDVGG